MSRPQEELQTQIPERESYRLAVTSYEVVPARKCRDKMWDILLSENIFIHQLF